MPNALKRGPAPIDAATLLHRVRQLVSTPATGRNPRITGPSKYLEAALRRIDQALAVAEQYRAVGTGGLPMTRIPRPLRLVARPVAKAILRAADLVARDQRAFNQSVLDALGAMRSTLETIPSLRQDLAEAQREVAELRSRLAAREDAELAPDKEPGDRR